MIQRVLGAKHCYQSSDTLAAPVREVLVQFSVEIIFQIY